MGIGISLLAAMTSTWFASTYSYERSDDERPNGAVAIERLALTSVYLVFHQVQYITSARMKEEGGG